MGLLFDLHFHTSRYSGDSVMDPSQVIAQAVKRGLQGACITEHHALWPQDELDELLAAAHAPGFVLLSGFEYTSSHGDVLIYGLNEEQSKTFVPRELSPDEAVAKAQAWGAACIAAHPTRQGLGFDERIFELPLQGMEVQSCNLDNNEQRLGFKLAEQLDLPKTASSDAHRLEDLGCYATEFLVPIQTLDDLVSALKQGQFRIPPPVST